MRSRGCRRIRRVSALATDSSRYEAWFHALERRDLLRFSGNAEESPNLFKDLSGCLCTDMEGNQVPFSSFGNRVVVADLFAFWCGACFPGLPNAFARLLFPPPNLADLIGINAVPTTLILDRHGAVRFEYVGFTNGSEEVIRGKLRC